MAEVSLVGTLLADRYEIKEEIGRGALGIVYKAQQRILNRPVAIKVLFEDLSKDPTSVKRFEREAQSASSLDHPNIVKIFDFGLSGHSFPFLAMDYLQGQSLKELIKKDKRVGIDRALPIFIQICAAMAHAHGRGIMHRDLKPDNVLLVNHEGEDDFVKIVDFGIAKRFQEEQNGGQRLTMEGQVMGTPAFMSPEQIMGGAGDARSDIYSLGCLMFNVLTGVLPISGESPIDTMAKHIRSAPIDFQTACPELVIPDSLKTVISKALRKTPAERQQTMQELRTELINTG